MGLPVRMKRVLSLILVAIFILSGSPLSALGENKVYTDSISGISFVVPSNWDLVSENNEATPQTKFRLHSDPSISIVFMRDDLYSTLDFTEKLQMSRSDFNNDYVMSHLEDFGFQKSKFERVQYGGVEYLKSIMTLSADLSGIDVGSNVSYLLRGLDGYVFAFMYAGSEGDSQYDDFLELILSVDYSTIHFDEYSIFPAGLSLNVSQDYVHELFSRSPDDTVELNGNYTEIYYVDYSDRPSAFDIGDIWTNYVDENFIYVIYESNLKGELLASTIAFHTTNHLLDENQINVITEYQNYCNSILKNPHFERNGYKFYYEWDDEIIVMMKAEMSEDGIELYLFISRK